MLKSVSICGIMIAFLSTSLAGDDAAPKKEDLNLDGISCVFCKKPVQKSFSIEYNGALVYAGCPGCASGIASAAKNDPKLAAAVNWQLVATGQATQKTCPMSKGKIDKKQVVKIKTKGSKTVDVAFCCPNCKKAAEAMKGDKQLLALFGDKVFKKSFQMKKDEPKTSAPSKS